jgi:hypothetical protein
VGPKGWKVKGRSKVGVEECVGRGCNCPDAMERKGLSGGGFLGYLVLSSSAFRDSCIGRLFFSRGEQPRKGICVLDQEAARQFTGDRGACGGCWGGGGGGGESGVAGVRYPVEWLVCGTSTTPGRVRGGV